MNNDVKLEAVDQNPAKIENQAEVKGVKNTQKLPHQPEKEKKQLLYRALRWFLTPLIKIMWPTKFINKENMNKVDGAIVVCNHYTKVDALIPARVFFKSELHVVVKAEAFDTAKISDWFLRKIGCIPIRRGEPDIDAVKAVLNILKNNKKLLIYPEGTRNKEGTKEMGVFKDGTARFAIKTKKPIVPMIFYSSPRCFRKNYLYVGEPFTMEQFYGLKKVDGFDCATQFIREKMLETRRLCDDYVENKQK